MEAVKIFVALLAAFAPPLAWLLFFLKEDLHPEPKKLLAKAFVFGALVTAPTFLVQSGVDYFLNGHFTALLVALAFLEELFKFLAAWFAVRKNPAFDEPVDAMIYTVAASLGFATVENLFIAGSAHPLSASIGEFLFTGGVLAAMTYRFVGATLLHVLASSLVGYAWARGRVPLEVAPAAEPRVPSGPPASLEVRRHGRLPMRNRIGPLTGLARLLLTGWGKKAGYITVGLVTATAVHSVFNLLIYRFEGENLIVPTLFLLIAGFFVLADFEKIKKLTTS